MRPLVTEIPVEPQAFPAWLERQLVGLVLPQLVAELGAIHGDSPEPALALEEALGDQLAQVLNRGLAGLGPDRLRALLTHPRLLLELQERVCTEGGDYWSRVAFDPEIDAAADRVWQRLQADLRIGSNGLLTSGQAANVSTPLATADALEKPQPKSSSRPSPVPATRLRPLLLGVAAMLVVGLGLWGWQFHEAAWGWNRPEMFAAGVSRVEYLERLSQGASEWFDDRPVAAAPLEKRLRAFRRGCDRLLQAEHAPLPAADRDWLLERCRAWAEKLDGHLADLKRGQDPTRVRAAADDTVQRLVDAIHNRAKQA